MAIAKMSLMTLVGLKSEQKALIEGLHKTCAVEIIKNEDCVANGSLSNDLDRLSFAYNFLYSNGNSILKDRKLDGLKEEVYGVNYDEFISLIDDRERVFSIVESVEKINDNLNELRVKESGVLAELKGYLPYIDFKGKFSDTLPTAYTSTFFGLLPTSQTNAVKEAVESLGGSLFVESSKDGVDVISIIILKAKDIEIASVLTQNSFVRSIFTGEFTPQEKIDGLNIQLNNVKKEIYDVESQIVDLTKEIKTLKIFADRTQLEIEKDKDIKGFDTTADTFTLTGYVPTKGVDRVKKAIESCSQNVWFEFEEVPLDKYAPTLTQNGKVTTQFEFITDLFSPPQYGSVDHNFVMMIFFSVFLGFIMADMGYGLLMLIGGLIVSKKQGRDTGFRRLVNVIAIGGIFTIIFGFLFDSFFGYGLFRAIGVLSKPIMPDAITEKMSLAGINVPTLLMLSLGMGVLHIIASLLLKMVQEFMHGNIVDGICDGLIWAIFLVGLIILVLSLANVTIDLTMPAIIIIGVSVLLGALTAGRHEKGFGKFTAGFSAIWGIINYLSDILSYARLYGLMLSGAKIAEIVTTMALPLVSGFTAPAGILILIIGHAFNLAMGLLGAYIHDSRLQYIEFFGRFYQSDGDKFTPFGTKFENTYFITK